MAADSISKLAVVVTGDTGPLGSALNAGKAHLTDFQSHTENRMQGVRHAILATHHVIRGFEGSVRGMAASALLLGGPAGAAFVAGAAVAYLGYESIKAADAIDSRFVESAKKMQEEFEKLGGKGKLATTELADQIDTIAEKWKAVGEQTERTLALMDRKSGGGSYIKDLLNDLNKGLFIAQQSLSTPQSRMQEAVRSQAAAEDKRRLELQKIIKENAKELDKQVEAYDHMVEKMRTRAKSLETSLRTPFEKMKDAMQEAQNLLEEGLLKPETVERVARKAMEEFEKASLKKRPEVGGVAAVERFTSAGFSAVQAAQRAEQARAHEQDELAKLTREEIKVLDQILTATKEKQQQPALLVRSNIGG